MPPKPVIRRRFILLHLPSEILAIIVIKLRLEELYSLRYTCRHLRYIVNSYVEELLQHGEDYDVIISAKSILTLKRIQVISLTYVVAPMSQDELFAIAKHPNLCCFTLDLTYLDDNFYSHVTSFITTFDKNKDYDISFVHKDKEAFRLVKNKLILVKTTSIKDVTSNLSTFNITSYRGRYIAELSSFPNLTSLEIVKPEKIDGLGNVLTSKIKHLYFDYPVDEIGQCNFHINDFINTLSNKHLTFSSITYLGPIDIEAIHKVGIIFPNVEVIEISLYSIMIKNCDITPFEDALRKYHEIIIDVEFYLLKTPQAIAMFPKHLQNKVRVRKSVV